MWGSWSTYEELKIEAVKQVTEKGKPVADVAQRLGMSVHSLYAWIKVYSKPQEQRQQDDDQQAELRKLLQLALDEVEVGFTVLG